MDDTVRFKDYWMVIRKNKKFILIGTLVCVIAAGVIASILPAIYQSTMILQIGELYLPPRTTESGVELIEEPEVTAKIIISDAVLDDIRKELQLELPLKELRGKLTVTPFKKDDFRKEMLPYLEVACQGRPPRKTVDILNALAGVIVNKHRQRYEAVQESLRNRIKNFHEKINASEKIVAEKTKSVLEIRKLIKEGDRDSREFMGEMEKLSDSETTPVELLFLQSSSLTEKRNVTSLKRIEDTLSTAIETEQQKVSEFKDQIDDTRNLIALSTPTEIKSAPVLPQEPIKPRKRLIVLVTGVLALTGTILWAFFRESI